MRTAEQMDVVLVRPNRFHLNRKPFRCRLPDNRRHRLIQQRFSIFHGKDTSYGESQVEAVVRSLRAPEPGNAVAPRARSSVCHLSS